jgi:acetyltransferase-like isoleucine patch superfamily enzyme
MIMIKKYFINLLIFQGNIWSYLYSYNINARIIAIKAILYSAWISREFKFCGKSSMIHPHCCLIGGKYISIGDGCSIGKGTVLTAWDKYGSETFMPQIIIGNNVAIGDDSHITAINRIEIGNFVLTGKKITITDNAHGKSNFELLSLPPAVRPLYSEGPVIIEDGVWIGDKVTILPNVRIGKNAIIGANAVVTRDIPANSVAGGIPAKVIKMIE